jgi:hypothetical protein
MAESKKYEISVAAETQYLADQSDPQDGRYVFAYTITLRNTGTIPDTGSSPTPNRTCRKCAASAWSATSLC